MVCNVDNFSTIATACKRSKVGKLLPDALYVHVSALPALDPLLQDYEETARQIASPTDIITLIKFSLEKPSISYLLYPDFEDDPHPALQVSIQVNLQAQEVNRRDYSNTANPFILHRKETFVTSDHPSYQNFSALTRQEESLGLLDNARSIGTRLAWEERLTQFKVAFQGHTLVHRSIVDAHSSQVKIGGEAAPIVHRHKAAISRNDFSKPVRLALEAGLINQGMSFFDYGCGQGGDLERISKLGYETSGWDPHYRPNVPLTSSDVVNLGYIINVVECQKERREALLSAWELTQKVLIVAAQVLIAQGNSQVAYGDGIITSRNTFQKYYDQQELKTYIDQILNVDAIPVALGIYFIFRDDTQAQTFRASRYRSRTTTPRIRPSIRRFEEYREILTPLMNFVTDRGRLPLKLETQDFQDLQTQFGTLHRAFQLVLQATDRQEWDTIADKRRQDILIYLALTRLRPRLRDLPLALQNDIKGLFGSYPQACTAADLMLLNLGTPGVIATCCQKSTIGKLTENSLLIHISALSALDPMLRMYEACASQTIGRMDTTTLIKFHLHKPKISYLDYPDFDHDAHPQLRTSMQIDLR